MTSDVTKPDGPRFSLSRWSERKRASARGEPLPGSMPADASASPVPSAGAAPSASAASAQAAAAVAPAAPAPDAAPLPPVESLTFDSDFTVFMRGDVDAAVKRSALRKLLRDPRFNVMDGLDTYIDDYSLPDPIEPSMLAQLRHSVATLNPVFDHPQADEVPVDLTANPALPPAAASASVPAVEAPMPAQIVDAELPAQTADAATPTQSAPPPAVPIGNRSGA